MSSHISFFLVRCYHHFRIFVISYASNNHSTYSLSLNLFNWFDSHLVTKIQLYRHVFKLFFPPGSKYPSSALHTPINYDTLRACKTPSPLPFPKLLSPHPHIFRLNRPPRHTAIPYFISSFPSISRFLTDRGRFLRNRIVLKFKWRHFVISIRQ